MSRKYRSRTSNINAAVWLIGIGLLWLTGLWWPGILILVGISMLVQVLVRSGVDEEPVVISTVDSTPAAVESDKVEEVTESKSAETWPDEKAETPSFIHEDKIPGDATLLPEKCPACGGPVAANAHSVEWIDDRAVRCPFCNKILDL